MKKVLVLSLIPLAVSVAFFVWSRSEPLDSVGHNTKSSDLYPGSNPGKSDALRPSAQLLSGELPAAEYGGSFAAELLREIRSVAESDEKNEAIEHLVDSLPASDIPFTFQCLAESGPAADQARQLLIRRWAESAPEAAAADALRIADASSQRAAIEQVVIAWANIDLPAAKQWLTDLPPGETRDAAARDLAYESARIDPLSAIGSAVSLLASEERDNLLCHISAQWASIEPRAAMNWAMQVSDEALRDRLLTSIATAAAKQDGVGAATMVAVAISPGAEQDRAAVAVAQRWAQSSPEAAAAWIQQFPTASLRSEAKQSLTDVFAAEGTEL